MGIRRKKTNVVRKRKGNPRHLKYNLGSKGTGRSGSFRSKFEQRLSAILPRSWAYEKARLRYTVTHTGTYTPDWTNPDETILVEAKGRFRTYAEVRKYLAIKAEYPDKTLVFIFQNPDTPMPGATRRKDGTKRSVSEWAAANGFEWCTAEGWEEWLNKTSASALSPSA